MSCDDIIIEVPEEVIVIEMTPEGKDGKDGNGIASIELISTVGLVKTYRITFTNGTHYDYEVEDGEAGAPGPAGNGIASISLISTSGLQKTYRITFTNGGHFDYVVTDGANGAPGADGVGIVSVYKTGTSGLVDTYTILYTNGNTDEFTVTNGAAGATGNGISSVEKIGTVGLVDTYRINFTNGSHYDYTVTNGQDGADPEWGNITGNIADQTDLKNALDAKANSADLGTMSAESASDYYDKDEVEDLINNSGVVAELDASGSIATFETNLAENLSRLNVSIDPVQDLHGYDNPWPAGGGKNLFGLKTIDNNDKGYRLVSTAGSSQYTISGTTSSNSRLMISDEVTLPAGTYCFSCKFTGTVTDETAFLLALQINNAWSGSMLGFAAGTYTNQRKSGTVTLSEASTVQLSVACNVGCVIDGTVSEIQFESGSSATTWQPYSNVCPISGHSSATVTRTGKNLLDITQGKTTVGTTTWIIDADGYVTQTSDADSRGWSYANAQWNIFLPAGTYIAVGEMKTYGSNSISISGRDTNNNSVAYLSLTSVGTFTSSAFTLSKGTEIGFMAKNNGGVYRFAIYQQANAPTAFESPTVQTVTISLGSTYYGAQLDAVAGTLTVDRAYMSPTSLKTGAYSIASTYYYPWIDISAPGEFLQGLCNKLICTTDAGVLNQKPSFVIRSSFITFSPEGHAYSNESDARTAGESFIQNGDVQFVYPITPTVITGLTPETISLLLGENNVWSDTGDVALSYFNNSTAEAITDVKQMIASTETSMTATRNYTSGSLIIVGPALLKATSNISSGASLVLGTNCVRTTLEEWILSLIA